MRHLRVLALLAAELRWRMLLLSERSGSLVLRYQYHGNGHAGREASLGPRPRSWSGHRVSALRLHALQMIPYTWSSSSLDACEWNSSHGASAVPVLWLSLSPGPVSVCTAGAPPAVRCTSRSSRGHRVHPGAWCPFSRGGALRLTPPRGALRSSSWSGTRCSACT